MVRLRGIEPPHAVPETTALSTELQAQFLPSYYNISVKFMQSFLLFFVSYLFICYNKSAII